MHLDPDLISRLLKITPICPHPRSIGFAISSIRCFSVAAALPNSEPVRLFLPFLVFHVKPSFLCIPVLTAVSDKTPFVPPSRFDNRLSSLRFLEISSALESPSHDFL